jgi:hypothetical protein
VPVLVPEICFGQSRSGWNLIERDDSLVSLKCHGLEIQCVIQFWLPQRYHRTTHSFRPDIILLDWELKHEASLGAMGDGVAVANKLRGQNAELDRIQF